MVFIFYYISKGMTLPFYGTYTIHELGLSLKYISFLTFANSTVRILFSMFWGKYADKKSFAAMIEKCFIFLLLASVAATLAVPSNGKIMFFFYYAFQGIALAGVNSAMINLVFDYVAPEKRADSLAICQAAAGLVGFLTTLASSALLEYIQRSGNSIFGISLYAQQFLSLISIFFLIVGIVYIRIVLIRKKS